MKKLLKYLKPFRFMILCIVFLIAVQAIGELYMPNLMSNIIDNGISKVEYNLDTKALKNAMLTDSVPELTAKLEEKGITKDIFILNSDNILASIENEMLSAENSDDLTSMDTEDYVLFQKMLSLGIIEAENVSDMEYIKEVGTTMIIVTFVIVCVTVLANFLSAKISMGYGKILRQKIFEKV